MHPSLRPWLVTAIGGLLVLATDQARANGNVSHQWVSQAASEQTPKGGSLHDLVADPTLASVLYTGTMFPDWGYTPGASSEQRSAGESAHWEPVQDGYRAWIMANYAPPWSDEARQHLAFYMGMTSHGIADQSYDAMFFERSRFFEPGDHSEFDQDTDVMWAATAGPGQVPRIWVPADPLLELFATVADANIEEDAMLSQLNFVSVGIAGVNALADDPAQVADAEADFPWAAMHDDDPATPGNPPHEAEIARRYWRSNWALLHGDPIPRPVLWTHPVDGGAEHPTDASSIDSWISIVFARALSAPQLDVSQFELVAADGTSVEIEIDLFYGDGSHVVHVRPLDDLADDTEYVLHISPDIATIHGEALEGWDLTFSTGARAPTPLHDEGFWDEPDPYGDEPGGDSTGGSDGDADTTAGPMTDSGSTSSPGTSGGNSSSGTSSGGADEAASGCGCRTRGDTRAGWLAAMLLLLSVRRRAKRS